MVIGSCASGTAGQVVPWYLALSATAFMVYAFRSPEYGAAYAHALASVRPTQ